MRRFTAGHNIFSHPKYTCMMYDPFTAEVFVEIMGGRTRVLVQKNNGQTPQGNHGEPSSSLIYLWLWTAAFRAATAL
jgi:hypothetical protein